MRILAIDPGASGGLCCYGDDRPLVASRMPSTESGIFRLVRTLGLEADRCVIEEISMRPGEGQRSTATFFQHYGFLRACLHSVGLPFETVRPQVWQAGLGLPSRKPPKGASKKIRAALKRQHKRDLAELARQRFPGVNLTLKTADAVLIAEWAWHRHKT